jgi:hypothetical protein
MSGKYTEIAHEFAKRLIECGVPDPKGLPPGVIDGLQKATAEVLRGGLLRIDRTSISGKDFLRIETIRDKEVSIFFVDL